MKNSERYKTSSPLERSFVNTGIKKESLSFTLNCNYMYLQILSVNVKTKVWWQIKMVRHFSVTLFFFNSVTSLTKKIVSFHLSMSKAVHFKKNENLVWFKIQLNKIFKIRLPHRNVSKFKSFMLRWKYKLKFDSKSRCWNFWSRLPSQTYTYVTHP